MRLEAEEGEGEDGGKKVNGSDQIRNVRNIRRQRLKKATKLSDQIRNVRQRLKSKMYI